MTIAAVPAIAQTKVTMAIVLVADGVDVFVAKEKGYFAKNGLDVDLVPIGVSANIPAALLSNSAQFGFATVPTVLQARDGGLDLVVVAGTSVTDPQDRMGVLARPGANINSPQDFVGKKVGAPGLNAFMHVLFRQWLTDKGVDYNKVNFVEASFPQMSDLLKGGTVDAVLAVEPIVSRIAAEKSGVVVARYVAETPPATPVLYVAASRDWARANDATVKAFKAGMREASQFVAANPDESREIIGKYTKLPPQALAAVQIPVRRIDPSEEGLAYWVDMMTRQKLLQKKPELSSLIYR